MSSAECYCSHAYATTGYLHYHSSDESDDDDDDRTMNYYQQNMGWAMSPPAVATSDQQGWCGYESDDDDEDVYEHEYDVADDNDSDGYRYEDYITMYDHGEDAMFSVSRSDDRSSNQRSNNPGRRAPTSAAAQPKPPPPPPVLCRFYVLGKCRYGSHCTYSHEIPAPSEDYEMTEEDSLTAAAALVDCPYFLRGNCKYGQYCRLRHAGASGATGGGNGVPQIVPSSSVAATAGTTGTTAVGRGNNQASGITDGTQPEQEFTCGICFDDVVDSGKHFGLLSTFACWCSISLAVLLATNADLTG